MIISQLRRIGEATIGTKTPYKILVDNQRNYTKKYLLSIEIDLSSPNVIRTIKPIEFDSKKIYDYALGITSGSSCNLSPSAAIKWPEIEKEELYKKNRSGNTKIVNLKKVVSIGKKLPTLKISSGLVFDFFNWLSNPNNCSDLRLKIVDYLYNQYIKKETIKANRPNIVLFSFRVKQNRRDVVLFPGEINELKDLYVKLSSINDSSEPKSGLCHSCNQVKPLQGPFNIGLYTLDQKSFAIGFRDKKSEQYQICNDCYLLCNHGFNYLEKNLKFHAYSYKSGKDTINVYHYLIPLSTDLAILKETLDQIARAKSRLNEKEKNNIEDRIKKLSDGLRRAEKAQKAKIKQRQKKLENLKKNVEKYASNKNISFDISELLEQLSTIKLSLLEVFFIISDAKQNPSVKEIVETILIKQTRVQQLANVFKNIRDEYGLERIYFWQLKNLVDNRSFKAYLRALLSGTPIPEENFLKATNKSLIASFKNEYFKEQKDYFSEKVRQFKVFYSLFEQASILKTEGTN